MVLSLYWKYIHGVWPVLLGLLAKVAKGIGLSLLGKKTYLVSSHTRNDPFDFKIDAVGSAAVYLVPILSLSNI